jgi:hypothetical protein
VASAADQLPKWILDRDTAEFPAVLHVLAEQHATMSIDGCCDDQGIVECQRVVACQLDRLCMNSEGQWTSRPDVAFDNVQSGLNLFPIPGQFASRYVREFISPFSSDAAGDIVGTYQVLYGPSHGFVRYRSASLCPECEAE